MLTKNKTSDLVRKAGVMSVVVTGSPARPGDPIVVQMPNPPHQPPRMGLTKQCRTTLSRKEQQ